MKEELEKRIKELRESLEGTYNGEYANELKGKMERLEQLYSDMYGY